MRVEAIQVENGFLIPRIALLKNIHQKKVIFNIEVIDQDEDEIDRFFNRYQIPLSAFTFDREDANAR